MKDLINEEQMESGIREMWDAIGHIPSNDPDRDFAINQAKETENTLRERFRKQEQLRNAAPELLEIVLRAIPILEQCDRFIIANEARLLIKKIEG